MAILKKKNCRHSKKIIVPKTSTHILFKNISYLNQTSF